MKLLRQIEAVSYVDLDVQDVIAVRFEISEDFGGLHALRTKLARELQEGYALAELGNWLTVLAGTEQL